MSDEPSIGAEAAARRPQSSAEAAMADMSRGKSKRAKGFVATAFTATIAIWLLTACTSGKGPADGNSPSHPIGRPTSPSPADTVVISTVPSVVPFVNAVLKKQGIDLPLESNKDECHPDEPSHSGTSGNASQVCRWHPDNAGSNGYRILSVDIEPEIDPQRAHEDLADHAKGIAPRPAELGDEAISEGVQFTQTAITVEGKDQSIASSGAELAVRVHNVIIDVTWAGADYKLSPDGTPVHVTGLTRESAARQATTIAEAVIAHLR